MDTKSFFFLHLMKNSDLFPVPVFCSRDNQVEIIIMVCIIIIIIVIFNIHKFD